MLDEVRGLKLHSDLVVLSACGQLHRREGVRSLARGFLEAGSSSVVCSLWRVNDVSTARWMDAFYQRLQESKSPAEAARLARLERIAAGESIFQWAPFIALGE